MRRHQPRRLNPSAENTPLARAAATVVEPLERRWMLAAHLSFTGNTNFGVTTVGATSPQLTFTLKNDGDTDAGQIEFDQNNSFQFGNLFTVISPLPTTLAVNQTANFTLALKTTQPLASGFVGIAAVSYSDSGFTNGLLNIATTGQVNPDSNVDKPQGSPTFNDTSSVQLTVGQDGAGNRPSNFTVHTYSFTLPAKSDIGMDVTATKNGQLGGDMLMIATPDTNKDGKLNQSELASPILQKTATGDGTLQHFDMTGLAAGAYFLRLQMTNPDAPNGGQGTAFLDYTLAVNATAVPLPDAKVTFGATTINDGDASPSAGEGTDFGSIDQGASSVVRTFTLTNIGGSDLSIGNVSVPGGFELESGLPTTLAAGASADFQVALLSNSAGAKSGQISFSTDAAGKNPYNFAVSGGVVATPTPTPTTPTPTTPTPTTPTPTTPTPTTPTPTPPPVRIASEDIRGIPASVVGGEKKAKGKVTVTITNTTDQLVTGPAAISLFASLDGVVDGTDLPIGSVMKNLKLKPGASKVLKVKVVIPAPQADGDFQILAAGTINGVDAGLAVGATTVHVAQPRVTLNGKVGTGVPVALTLGRKASLAVPITNSGNVPAKGTVAVDLIASTDGTLDAGKTFTLASFAAVKVSVNPGATKAAKIKLTVPATLPAGFTPGSYTLIVRLGGSTFKAVNTTDGAVLSALPITLA